MKYGLEINTVKFGDSSAVVVDAEGGIDDGVLTLAYRFDGAEYILSVDGNGITQERLGDLYILMHISAEGKSFFTLRDTSGEGTVDLEVSGFSVSFDGNVCRAECNYLYSGEEEEIRLTVHAMPIA